MADDYSKEIGELALRRATLALAVDHPNPDQAARAGRVARETGLPVATVNDNLSVLSKQVEAARARKLLEREPKLAAWASDPHNAAVGSDDMDGLARSAKAWSRAGEGSITAAKRPDGTLWNALKGLGTAFSEGLGRLPGDIQRIGADWLPSFDLAAPGTPRLKDAGQENARRASVRSTALVDATTPDFKSNTARYLYGGASSLAQTLPAVGLGVFGGAPIGLAAAGAQAALPAYSKYRDRGGTRGEALLGGVLEGGIEVASEKLPMDFLVNRLGKLGAGKFIAGYLGRDMPGEMAASLAQNAVDTAIANPDKTWGEYLKEQPDALMQAAVSSLMSGAFFAGAGKVGRRLARDDITSTQAMEDADTLGRAMDSAAASKTRARDPDAFRSFIERFTTGSRVENVFVPAETVATYFQSLDEDYRNDDFWGEYADQIDEGLATGGDVVLPTAHAAAHLSGTPAWEAIKADVRASPGGPSLAEVESQRASYEQTMEQLGADMAEQLAADEAAAAPRNRIYQDIRDKLTNAGYTQDAAHTQAEIVAQRAATRAARAGRELVGDETANIEVQRILPERLAPIVAADSGDVAVRSLANVLRRKSGVKVSRGMSLLEWIGRQGGIEDRGGDLASMGANDWHKGKPGKRKLIRPHTDLNQGAMLGDGAAQNANTPDEMALRAQEAGYFPAGERPDINTLFEAIDQELRGEPVYRLDMADMDAERTAEAAEDLAMILDQQDVDIATATDAEIVKAVRAYQQQAMQGGYQQADVKSAAFRAWFGDSKVVDAKGRPQVVYHGSPDLRELNDAGFFATNDERAVAAGFLGGDWPERAVKERAYFFTPDRKAATSYTDRFRAYDRENAEPGLVPVYISLQNPLVVDFGGERWTGTDAAIARAKGEGYDGLIVENVRDHYQSGKTQKGDKPHRVVVAFSPEQIKSVDNSGAFDPTDPRILYQTFGDGPRGQINFQPDGRSVISLFEAANLSTFMHEMGHQWLEELRADAETASGMVRLYRGEGSREASRQGDATTEGAIWFTTEPELAANYAARRNGEVFALDLPRDRAEELLAGGHTANVPEAEAAGMRKFTNLASLRAEAMKRGESLTPDEVKAHTNLLLPAESRSQVARDWQTVADWFAANGHPIADDGTIPVEAHEMWARGVERFLMEGKAPSTGLRRVFEKVKAWMLDIYQVVENLRAPITPEIRDVMNRLMATDEEIALAQEREALSATFDGEALGMSEAEHAAYVALSSTAKDEAYEALLYRTMASVRRQRTAAWKAEEQTVRADVTERVDARPEFRALRLLRTGRLEAGDEKETIRLDREWLVQQYGEGVLGTLPRGVPPIYGDNGIHADEIAERVGFASGDEMVRTLIAVEDRKRAMADAKDKRSVRQALIDEETQAEMLARHGDILADGSIEEEALALIHNDTQGEKLAAELRSLSRRAQRQPTPYQLAKDWAREKVAGSQVRDAVSGATIQRYARAAAKAGREAEQAIIKRDYDTAYDAKRRQMLNNALLAEAQRMREAVEKARDRLAGYAKKRTIKSMDQDYLDQIHALLEDVELKRRTGRDVSRQESFEAWAKARAAEGHDVVVPDSFAASLGQTNWTLLTVEKMIGLDEAVAQIAHLGRFKQKLLDGADARDFADMLNDAEASVDGMKRTPPVDGFLQPGPLKRAATFALSIDAAMLKMETVFSWLDQGNPNGFFTRVVFQRMVDAQEARRKRTVEIRQLLETARQAVPVEQRKRWGDKLTLPFIDQETGKAAVMTRDQVIAMALNLGNEQNARKLAKGHGWNEDAIRDYVDSVLTIEEWRYVQGVWDSIDTLWPDLAALERRVNGVAPEKVEPRALQTKAGELRGGYYPVVYDPTRDKRAEALGEESVDDLFSKSNRATTRAGATNERTEYTGPIYLSLSVIDRHVGEVIHDITHREAVIDAWRLLTHPRIERMVDEVLGVEVRKQVKPWIKHIANEFAYDAQGTAALESFFKGLRTNVTFVGLSFRASTILTQFAGLINSSEVVGARHMLAGIYQSAKSPVEATRFALDASQELRGRMETLDRDVRDSIQREQSKVGWLSDAKLFGFKMIGYTDRFVSVITWTAAYNRGLLEKMSEEQAVAYADKVIRQSQGSGAAKDLAAIQRGKGKAGEAAKMLTFFYSYMSAFYQRQRTLGRDYGYAISNRRVKDMPDLLARTVALYILPAIASELIKNGAPDDDEDWGMWAAKLIALSALGPIPFIRDVAGALESGFDYQFSPAASVGTSFVRVAKDGERILAGEETKTATRDTLQAIGYATGWVPGQAAATAQFLVDVAEGDQHPETAGEWYRGLTKGKAKDE